MSAAEKQRDSLRYRANLGRRHWVVTLLVPVIGLILSCGPAVRLKTISGEFTVIYLDDKNYNYHLIAVQDLDSTTYIVLSDRVFLDVDTLMPGCANLEVGGKYRLRLEESTPQPQLWTLNSVNDQHLLHRGANDVLRGISTDTTLLLNFDHSFRSKVYKSPDIVDGYVLTEGCTCRPCDRDWPGAWPLVDQTLSWPDVVRYLEDYWVDDTIPPPQELIDKDLLWDADTKVLYICGECITNQSIHPKFWLVENTHDSASEFMLAWASSLPTLSANRLVFQVLDIKGDDAHLIFDYPSAKIRCELRYHCWGYGWTLVSSEIRELSESQ